MERNVPAMDPGNRRISLIVQYLEKPATTDSDAAGKEVDKTSEGGRGEQPAKESEKH